MTLIFETIYGSRAFGLDRPDSDTDLRGVFVAPEAQYLGFVGGPEQVEPRDETMWWELRKFLRLAAAGNPTILEVLWTDASHHRVVTAAGERLLTARSLSLSKRIAGSFGEYAMSQLKRIRTHRQWLLSPPTAAPRRADFGLPDRAVLSKDQMGAAGALLDAGRLAEADVTPNFLAVLDAERRYKQARAHWTQFQTWQSKRNPARAALEATHGYDTKHAQHLIRLLRMAREGLETGALTVLRLDRDELLAIRDGAWSYDELIERAEALRNEIRALVSTSPLPATADEADLDALCVSIAREVHRAA